MTKYAWGGVDFAEDRLPPNQKPILTSSVKRFIAFMGLVTDPQMGYSSMGVVTGPPGIGKTIAIQAYLDALEPRAHTGLPSIVKIKVKPRSTPKALAQDIVAALKDKPRGSNIYQVADEAAEAMIRNDLDCLVADEGDRLNQDSFEVLRHLHDKTGRSIVVVGLPSIQRVIDRKEKFASRVGLRMEFLPLSSDEILEVVLPNLIFPRWEFDLSNEGDREMGELICSMVNSSLRKLRNLLQIASQMAEHYDAPRVTPDLIRGAFAWSATNEDRRRLSGDAASGEDEEDDESGEMEQVSEARHKAKKGK